MSGEETQVEGWLEIASQGDVDSNTKSTEGPYAKARNSFVRETKENGSIHVN